MKSEEKGEKPEKPKLQRKSIAWGGPTRKAFSSTVCHDTIQEAADKLGMTFAGFLRRFGYRAAQEELGWDDEA